MSGSILVVGAGIAGRAAARALALHDLGCTVVERRPAPRRLGMGLNLPGNAMRALEELGAADQVAAHGVPVRRREYRNGAGRLLFAADDEAFWRGVGRPSCTRHGHLIGALQLPTTAVVLKHARAVAAEPGPEAVRVLIEGEGRPRYFDLVVGADGVHSAMRPAITGVEARPSSMTGSSWRFIVDNPGIDCWTAWSGSNETFLLIPVAEGRVYGYAASTRGGQTGAAPNGWRVPSRGSRNRWSGRLMACWRVRESSTTQASTRCASTAGTRVG